MFENQITAVITTSPIPSHPSTRVIDQTIDSIRWHLPDIPILILADGVREEQKDMASNYDAYLRNLQSRGDANIFCSQFKEFSHQAGMMRVAIWNDWIQKPLVLWVEHDFPLVKEPINWSGIVRLLLENDVCSVRFRGIDDTKKEYYERGEIEKYGVKVIKTVEFSSLPNIARRDMYEFIVPHYDKAQIHLECNKICGLFHKDNCIDWKLSTYEPPDGKGRFYSIDGRAGTGPKLPMRF